MTSIYFDPDGAGLEVFLGPTEAQLMELAWDKKTLTVKKALFFLGEENKRAYTTIMTVLTRLADKGLLNRERQGRSFVYTPAVDKATFVKDRVRTITRCLKRNFSNLK